MLCVLECTVYKGVSEVADLLGRAEGLWKKQNLTLTLAELCSVKQIIHRTEAEF